MVEDHGCLIADVSAEGCIVINRVLRKTDGYLVRPDQMPSQMVEWYLHFTLGELLKHRGLYAMHATALEKDGRGVLIPGYSGQGKTTSFLSLLRAGYRYISDDTPWLRMNGSQVEMLSFSMKVDVTDRTSEFFPELQQSSSGLLHQGLYKKYFHVEDVYPGAIGESCEPALIVFPRVIDAPYSRLEPLAKREAFRRILPQAVVVHDQDIARKEFDTLSKLVQQADCYTLHFGWNILDLSQLVTPLLQRSCAA